MQSNSIEQERDGCDEASLGPFRRTIAALEASWIAKARRAPLYPFVTWTREGPRLGAATLLARKGAGENARLLSLLSVAYGFAVPASVLKHLACAEKEFEQGDLAKSAMHVALTGLPAFRGNELAHRLHITAGILDDEFLSPLGLMKACEFDGAEIESLAKSYDPNEPRVPKGNPDGGEWTRDSDTAEPPSRAGGGPPGSEGPLLVAILNQQF